MAREGDSGDKTMQDIIGHRFPILRGDNRRQVGWGMCREYLKIDNGKSKFTVFSNCVNFTRTVPACIHDKVKPEDLDTDGEDHTADEFRMACMSRPIKHIDKDETIDMGFWSPAYHIKEMEDNQSLESSFV